jgi:hypothetical protein
VFLSTIFYGIRVNFIQFHLNYKFYMLFKKFPLIKNMYTMYLNEHPRRNLKTHHFQQLPENFKTPKEN